MSRYRKSRHAATPLSRNPLARLLLYRLTREHPGKTEIRVRSFEIEYHTPNATPQQRQRALKVLNAHAVNTLSRRGTVTRWYTVVRPPAETGPHIGTFGHDVKPHIGTFGRDVSAIIAQTTQPVTNEVNIMPVPPKRKMGRIEAGNIEEVCQNLTSPPHTPPYRPPSKVRGPCASPEARRGSGGGDPPENPPLGGRPPEPPLPEPETLTGPTPTIPAHRSTITTPPPRVKQTVWQKVREVMTESGQYDPLNPGRPIDPRELPPPPSPRVSPQTPSQTSVTPSGRGDPPSTLAGVATPFSQVARRSITVVPSNGRPNLDLSVGVRCTQEARDKGLIPLAIWDVAPPSIVPKFPTLVATMSPEGKVERLIRAHREVGHRRFRKYPKPLRAKALLNSVQYSDLMLNAIGAFEECEIAPLGWVAWAADKWIELKSKGRDAWGKMPPFEWVYSPQVIIPWRHAYRERVPRGGGDFEKKHYTETHTELLTLAMEMERMLPHSQSVEEVVATFRQSFPDGRWDTLVEQVKLEQYQTQAEWDLKLKLGEWISEWTL